MKKNVSQVIEELKAYGFTADQIELNIEKGLKPDGGGDPIYVDDRSQSVIPQDKFRQIMDSLAEVVKPGVEVDIAKSASAAVAGAAKAASGKAPEAVSNSEVLKGVELLLEKSETIVNILQNGIPFLAELLGMSVNGVVNLEKSQTRELSAVRTAIGNTRPVAAAGSKVVQAGAGNNTGAKGTDERPTEDEGESFEIFKSEVYGRVMGEVGAVTTDMPRRLTLGKAASVLAAVDNVAGLTKVATELGYHDTIKKHARGA